MTSSPENHSVRQGVAAATSFGAAILLLATGVLSLLGNFLWLPYYPLWSILLIALDIVVIWAITTWRPQT